MTYLWDIDPEYQQHVRQEMTGCDQCLREGFCCQEHLDMQFKEV